MRTSQNVCSLRNTETLTQRHVYTFATLIAIKNLALKETLFKCKFGSRLRSKMVPPLFFVVPYSVEVRVCTEVRRCYYKTQNLALVTTPCSNGLHRKGPWSSEKSRFMVTSSILSLPFSFFLSDSSTKTTPKEPTSSLSSASLLLGKDFSYLDPKGQVGRRTWFF